MRDTPTTLHTDYNGYSGWVAVMLWDLGKSIPRSRSLTITDRFTERQNSNYNTNRCATYQLLYIQTTMAQPGRIITVGLGRGNALGPRKVNSYIPKPTITDRFTERQNSNYNTNRCATTRLLYIQTTMDIRAGSR